MIAEWFLVIAFYKSGVFQIPMPDKESCLSASIETAQHLSKRRFDSTVYCISNKGEVIP
jgi:hypothetical protein